MSRRMLSVQLPLRLLQRGHLFYTTPSAGYLRQEQVARKLLTALLPVSDVC